MKALNTRVFGVLIGLVGVMPAARTEPPPILESVVVNQKSDKHWEVFVVGHVAVPKSVAWETMTDYNHQADFIPTVASCRLIQNGNESEVHHVGQMRFLFFRLQRRVVFNLRMDRDAGTIDMHAIAGDFKSFDQHVDITPTSDHTVDIRYHGNIEPKGWLPKWIVKGRVKSSAETTMLACFNEMERRYKASAGYQSPQSDQKQ